MEDIKESKEESIELTQDEALMLSLYKLALSKNLGLFIFEKEELKQYHNIDETKNFAIVTIAKNRDNATWNVKNLKRCYVLNDYK